MMVLMYMSWDKLWEDWKITRQLIMMEFHLMSMSLHLSDCMLTGMLPIALMHVVVIPLLKCKSKDPADVNNYRPIAIATALSKVLEQVLLSRLAKYLWTADSQFGFKWGHGIKMAIFALKQTVDFYRNRDTTVYMCFLDAKKSFYRVTHWTLAKKLLDIHKCVIAYYQIVYLLV